MAPDALCGENLTKVFVPERGLRFWRVERERKVAVDQVTISVPRGRITGLLGVNGAGKTTTIKMLATLLRPTSGSVSVDGLDATNRPELVRPIVNMIAGGDRALYPRLTARENLWYFGQLYNVEPRTLAARIECLLRLVELADRADALVEQLSKGMKQRLQIARGLINAPRYLLLDEPTLGLDAPIARQLRRMTRDLASVEGCGILLTSHYMSEIEELCQYIYVIHQGRIVAEGSVAHIRGLGASGHAARVEVATTSAATVPLELLSQQAAGRGITVSIQVADGQATLTASGPAGLTPAVVELCSQAGYPVLHAESVEPSLEDALVALTAQEGET